MRWPSDALGLSEVHTTRVWQALRDDRMITWQAGPLIVEDRDGLRWIGEFDPAYLHLAKNAQNAAA